MEMENWLACSTVDNIVKLHCYLWQAGKIGEIAYCYSAWKIFHFTIPQTVKKLKRPRSVRMSGESNLASLVCDVLLLRMVQKQRLVWIHDLLVVSTPVTQSQLFTPLAQLSVYNATLYITWCTCLYYFTTTKVYTYNVHWTKGPTYAFFSHLLISDLFELMAFSDFLLLLHTYWRYMRDHLCGTVFLLSYGEITLHTFKGQLKAYLFHIWCDGEQKEHSPPACAVVAFSSFWCWIQNCRLT